MLPPKTFQPFILPLLFLLKKMNDSTILALCLEVSSCRCFGTNVLHMWICSTSATHALLVRSLSNAFIAYLTDMRAIMTPIAIESCSPEPILVSSDSMNSMESLVDMPNILMDICAMEEPYDLPLKLISSLWIGFHVLVGLSLPSCFGVSAGIGSVGPTSFSQSVVPTLYSITVKSSVLSVVAMT